MRTLCHLWRHCTSERRLIMNLSAMLAQDLAPSISTPLRSAMSSSGTQRPERRIMGPSSSVSAPSSVSPSLCSLIASSEERRSGAGW